MSPEQALYNFLKLKIEGSPSNHVLHGEPVLPSLYSRVEKSAIRVGSCKSKLSPKGEEIYESNAVILIQVLRRISTDENADDTFEAIEFVRDGSIEIVKWLSERPSPIEFCDLTVEDGLRDIANFQGAPHAVALIPVVINPL